MQQDSSMWVTCAQQVACHTRDLTTDCGRPWGCWGGRSLSLDLCLQAAASTGLLVHSREFNKNTHWYKNLYH